MDKTQLFNKGKYHCTADLLFYLFGFSCFASLNYLFWSNQYQSNRSAVQLCCPLQSKWVLSELTDHQWSTISALDFGEFKDNEPEATDGPYINAAMSPDVIGVLGKDVRLACHVTNLGNKTVIDNQLTCETYIELRTCMVGVGVRGWDKTNK